MKILMVNKYLYQKGGAETYMLKLGEELADLGNEVEYFGMYDEKNTVGNSVGAYTSNLDFHKRSLSMLTYPFKIIYSPDSRKQIRRVLESFKPDVVHMNNINYQLTPSVIYEIKKHNIPIVSTAHDVQWVCPNHMMTDIRTMEPCDRCIGGKFIPCTKNKCIHNSTLRSVLGTIESRLYRNLHTYRMVDMTICPSRFMEKQLEHNPDLKGRTTVIYNFIDKLEKQKVKKQDYVLFFGRYSKEKGIRTLLKSAKKLPDIKFVFAGHGELEAEINELENAENVGFKSGAELNGLIAGALFSVLPSEWAENCPFSVMESQSLLTPVIGADAGGIPELIEDGKTGLVFESRNEEDLTEKIRYLYDNRELAYKLSENCREIHYDNVEEYAIRLTGLYKALMKEG